MSLARGTQSLSGVRGNLERYTGLPRSSHTACQCDLAGSFNGACDVASGQCPCLQNVARAVDVGTSGVAGDRRCSECLQTFYGHGTNLGCLPCNCHPTGASSSQCDNSGQCPCVDSVQGLQCSRCSPGYFAFGTGGCSPCGCNKAGSLSESCDQTFGTCTCKDHVTGTQCDACKPGYFNLMSVNPRGCQPCFCFQHGSTCSVASGFVYDTVTSDSSVTWNTTDDHYVVPPYFLGDRHVSYGQLVSFQFATSLPVTNVTNVTMVILQGDEEQGPVRLIHMLPILPLSSPTTGRLAVRLLATNWRKDDGTTPDEENMLRVLADLSAILLPRQLPGVTLTYTDIVLETAVSGTDGNVSAHVENCTCNPASAVTGLSCENCAQGARRVNTNLTSPYQVCTACDCSGRALTTPPLCDQWTGVCLNCRNGTEGDRCQSCAPHVQGAECNVCEDGFWGLGQDGCRACNCSEPGSTSSLCDKESGQCTCAPFVTGRTCDRCQQNYHQLTSSGCQECDECYKLVMGEVTSLRNLLDNLTSSVTQLETNDQTSLLGEFSPRLNEAVATSQQLLAFLQDATQAEVTVRGQLATLTSLIQDLQDTVTRLAENATTDIDATLSLTSQLFENAIITSQTATDNVRSAYSQTDSLASVVTSLQALATSLRVVEGELKTRADNLETGRQVAVAELQNLEQVVTEANTEAQSKLQAVQSALVVHQNNSRRLTDLEGVDVTLNVLSTETLTEARQVRTKSDDVIQTANRLQSAVAAIGQPGINIAELRQAATDVTSRADVLQTQATQASFNFSTTETQISTAVASTEALRARVQNLVDDAGGLTSRVTSAGQVARAAQESASAVFQEAETMLQTMRNFETIAQDVEEATNTSLGVVDDMRKASADVRAEAANVTSSLDASQQAASQALDTARQAKAVADAQYSRLSPLAVTAQGLQNTSSAALSDVTLTSQTPQNLLMLQVRPANLTCGQQQQLVASVTTQVETAASTAENATSRVVTASGRASTLLSNLRSLPSLDVTRIQTLLAEVNGVRAQLNTTELTSAINALQADSAALASRVAQLTASKAQLQASVDQLRAIQEQLVP